jgi:hypothetical protein
LSGVQTNKFRRQAQVGAVIHDQPDRVSDSPFQLASVFQNLPGGTNFVSVLQQRDAPGRQFLRRSKHSLAVGKLPRSQNRVQPWKMDKS